MGLEDIKTEAIANYSAALIKGFEILEDFRNLELGACCNQAIMLVSDGVRFYNKIWSQWFIEFLYRFHTILPS